MRRLVLVVFGVFEDRGVINDVFKGKYIANFQQCYIAAGIQRFCLTGFPRVGIID